MSTKPGRNDPCYCGSGKKYKKCHLAIDQAARPVPPPPPEEEVSAPPEDAHVPAPRFLHGPSPFKDMRSMSKWLAKSDVAKHDPELRKLLNGPVLKYVAQGDEIDAACAKLKPYEEEFQHLFDDREAFMKRCDAVFGEESFVHLRFSRDDVRRAFENVGYPPNTGDSGETNEILIKAIRFLATKQLRNHHAMELMLCVPKYVDHSRFIDARLIGFAAQVTAEAEDPANPFLLRMFSYGVEAWEDEQEAAKQALVRKLGLPDPANLSPDELEAWLAEQTSDPEKRARLQRLFDANPELRRQSAATLDSMHLHAVDVFEREDAACLLLGADEIEPWVPLLTEKLKVLQKKYGPLEEGPRLSEAQQAEAFDTVYLPAMREIAKGIFTPERILKLVADLKSYRGRLFAAGEKAAASYATAAIHYVEPEDEPGENVFLINLCARSITGLSSISA